MLFISYLVIFGLKKTKKNTKFQIEFLVHKIRKMLETLFLGILVGLKGYGGVNISEKSQNLGSLGSLFLGVIAPPTGVGLKSALES